MVARRLIVITNSQRTLTVESMAPETLNRLRRSSMSKQEPETKDGLSKNIKNSISNDLRINTPLASTITDTPDNGVESPEDQSEATDGSKELGGSVVLGQRSTTTRDDELVDDDEVCDASNSIVSPLLAIILAKGSKETKENHDDVRNDGDEDACSIHASKESKVQEQERSGQAPVNVAGPEDLAEDVVDGVGDVIVCFLNDDVGEGVSVSGSHGEVGDGCEGGDEGGDNVEESLLNWDSPCQGCECQGGQQHDREDDPEGFRASLANLLKVWWSWNDGWNWGD